MRKNRYGALLVALSITSFAGCQTMSGWTSRLAWWKSDAASSDTSLVARSASPVLPSQLATSQTDTGGTAPAANYAVAPTSPSMGQAPAYSYTATAPTAAYPATNTGYPAAAYAPNQGTAGAGSMSPSPAVASNATPYSAAPTTPTNSYAQQGAYDAGNYQPVASQSAPSRTDAMANQANPTAPPSDDRYASADASASNRYAMSPTSYAAQEPTPPAAGNTYGYGAAPTSAAPVNSAPTTPVTQDRYNVAGAYNPGAAASNSTMPPTGSPGGWPTSTPQVADASANPSYGASAGQAVRLDAAAGQYRPAGTSNYQVANQQYGQVNVATRADASVTPTSGGQSVPQAAYPYYSPSTNTSYGTY